MDSKLQEEMISAWADFQLNSYRNHPELQRSLALSLEGEKEKLRQVVNLGWEVHKPSYPIIDFRAFKPSASAPKRVEVWAVTPGSLLEKCTARNDEPAKCHRNACCEQAELIGCVCAYSWRCPVHGERHHGTHD